MRGPRIRKIAYVPEAERPVRNDLVRVLTAATASFYPKDARGDAMHAERWRVRIHRTRDLGKLRYTTSSEGPWTEAKADAERAALQAITPALRAALARVQEILPGYTPDDDARKWFDRPTSEASA